MITEERDFAAAIQHSCRYYGAFTPAKTIAVCRAAGARAMEGGVEALAMPRYCPVDAETTIPARAGSGYPAAFFRTFARISEQFVQQGLRNFVQNSLAELAGAPSTKP